jgi:hypothetical protein
MKQNASATHRSQPRPDDARLAVLAAEHRIGAPAEDHVLGAKQHHREDEQRQRRRGGELGLRRILEQAPDLGGHGVEAGRQRQDRGRAEQRHGLQNATSAPASTAGSASGMVTRRAVTQVPPPRIDEASSSSPGVRSSALATSTKT